MTRDARHMQGMVDLTAAAYEATQSRMGALKSQEVELRQKLEALAASRNHEPRDAQVTDPARRAGADLLWQRWVDGRRSSLNMELVNNLVAQSITKKALAKEFGRHEAIKGLKEKQDKLARAERVRRAERYGL